MFHTATLAGFNYSQSELELTNHMVLYWTNFAHHGNPNGPQDSPQVRNIILESVFPTLNFSFSLHLQDLMEWPSFDSDKNGVYMRFRAPGSDVSVCVCACVHARMRIWAVCVCACVCEFQRLITA